MRGFSDEERDRIYEELVETGRELLLTYGPEKTNVADVTEPVGIANSTFYRFFDSKSELYLEIMRREVAAFNETVDEAMADATGPRDGLERLFHCYADFCEENPLFQQIGTTGAYQGFYTDVSPEARAEVQQGIMAAFVPVIESLQAESDGLLAEYDASTVLGIMAVIKLLALYVEEFDDWEEGFYERVKEGVITSIILGLTVDEPGSPAR